MKCHDRDGHGDLMREGGRIGGSLQYAKSTTFRIIPASTLNNNAKSAKSANFCIFNRNSKTIRFCLGYFRKKSR